MKISVIGQGKLGFPFTVTAASKKHHVIGVDKSAKIIKQIESGKEHIKEPLAFDLYEKYEENIKLTQDTHLAVEESEITFIIVPTPSKKNGKFSLKYVKEAAREIALGIKKKKSYHLIVLTSTVLPGDSDKIVQYIEKYSEKKCGNGFGFCYSPEFIALGRVIYDLLNPDMLLIGEPDKTAGDKLVKFYKDFCDSSEDVARMNFVNADVTKISVNTYVTTKISYANMLSEVCEQVNGADVDVVTSALGIDSRIGKKYLKGGLGFGGPCFPRDNFAFISMAQDFHVTSYIANATHITNLHQHERITSLLEKLCREDKSVGFLGMSYKPDTDVIGESAQFHIVDKLLGKAKINLYDPTALANCEEAFGDKVNYFSSIKSCIRESDIVFIGTLWKEVIELKSDYFISTSTKLVIDPWRSFKNFQFPPNVSYLPLGMNTSEMKLVKFFTEAKYINGACKQAENKIGSKRKYAEVVRQELS